MAKIGSLVVGAIGGIGVGAAAVALVSTGMNSLLPGVLGGVPTMVVAWTVGIFGGLMAFKGFSMAGAVLPF